LKKNTAFVRRKQNQTQWFGDSVFVIMMFPARLRALNLTLNHARDAAHTRADIPSLDELYHRRIRAWNPKSGKAALSRDLPVSPCRADRATENRRFIRCWNSQESQRKMRSLVSSISLSYRTIGPLYLECKRSPSSIFFNPALKYLINISRAKCVWEFWKLLRDVKAIEFI